MKMKLTAFLIGSLILSVFVSISSFAGTENYTYDNAGRLIKVDYGSGKTIEYTYDNNSNLLTREVENPTSQKTLPSIPVLNSPTGTIQTTAPDFHWSEDVNSTWYKIFIRNDSDSFKFVQWYEITDNYSNYPDASCNGSQCSTTLDSGLVPDNYTWWVRGWNENGNGDWSTGAAFTIQGDTSLPSKITLLSPSNSTNDSLTFTWNKDTNSTWYKLYIANTTKTFKYVQWYEDGDNSANYPNVSCSDNSCSVMLESALANDNYQWWVIGWNSNGNGEWSDTMAFEVTD